VNKVLHENQTILPNIVKSNRDMVQCINNFFGQKILNIHSEFSSSTLAQGMRLVEESCISTMYMFEPFTETDIRELLLSVQLTYMSCERGSGCSDMTDYIVNKSLFLGVFSGSMKAAHVKPSLKTFWTVIF